MIYTKTGDRGTTSLVGGSRVAKDDHRVEAYGTVDELNSHIGLLAEMLRTTQGGYYDELKAVQHNLFTLQTLLATEDETIYARLPQLAEEHLQIADAQGLQGTVAIAVLLHGHAGCGIHQRGHHKGHLGPQQQNSIQRRWALVSSRSFSMRELEKSSPSSSEKSEAAVSWAMASASARFQTVKRVSP